MKNHLLFLWLLLSCSTLVYCQNSDENNFLVAPYLQFSTQTEISVLWETHTPATSLVRFGEAQLDVEQALLDQQVSLPDTRLLHELKLSPLQPETNYFWQVISITEKGDTLRSDVYSFKTAVKDDSGFVFALVGDSQRNSRTPWAWEKIAGLVWQDRPNFVVHAGDLVDTGTRKTDWTEHFFPGGHQLMSRIPLYPVLGNHEQDADYYYQYIVAPQPEYYYTFTYGNAQFFMIDTNRDISEGSEQYEWLDWELARSTATWKIVVHHHPPYSSEADDHGDTFYQKSTLGTKARNLVPLYDQYGVDFCLFGHTHVYERSWPLKNDMINMQNGVIYINSGGAGGGLEDFAPTRNWFTQELQTGHHYCTFAVFQDHLIFKAIDDEGRLFDTFQMQKSKARQDQASVVQPPAAHIKAAATLFEQETTVQLSAAFDSLQIRYTLDGSTPNQNSPLYSEPLTIKQTTTLQARAYTSDGRASRNNSIELRQMKPQAATPVNNTIAGLQYRYYEGAWHQLPDFTTLTPKKEGIVQKLTLSEIPHREDHFGVVLEGYVEVPENGLYTFFINSDDGSKLYLNDALIIDHDGDHSAIKKTGQAILAAGKHRLRIEYFENGGSQFLQAGWIDKTMGAKPFGMFMLSHKK